MAHVNLALIYFWPGVALGFSLLSTAIGNSNGL